MVATPEIIVTDSKTRAVVSVGVDMRVSDSKVRAVINFPTETLLVPQATVRAVQESSVDILVTQALVRAIVKGRVAEPNIRAWTFTLDNHDYYVLRLGSEETLVYDTHSKQWYTWGSNDSRLWRAYQGTNWIGGTSIAAANNYSNVIVGDDGNGALYWLSPEDDSDDDALVGSDTLRPFGREVTGQVIVTSYNRIPCFGLQLHGSIGSSDTGTVNLQVSDDRGATYTDIGDITVTNADYTARVHWRSLGSMQVPGRLFKITDTGALKRIDRLDMDENR